MPDGADTVVIQEHTKRDGDCVEVEKPAAKGRHIRAQGLDFKAGETLLEAGHRLTARDLALAAAMNHPLVPVHRRPKVALFATGDELVPPGMQPAPGQIVSSNTFALAALARARRRRGHRSRHRRRPARRYDRGRAPRARTRRRHSGHHRRRLGRRLRSRAAGVRRRGHGAVVLAIGAAAGPPAHARPARRHAGARRARQSGLGVRLRISVPGAADPPPRRTQRSGDADRIGAARLRPCPKTTSAPIICAQR